MGVPLVKDVLLKQTRALPASTSAVASSALDLELSAKSDHVAHCEVVVSAPALSTAQLPDTKVMVYTLETDDNSGFSSATTVATLGTQTGAGGAGAAAAEYRAKLPTNCERYLRLKVTPSASGTGDASAATATMEIAV